MFCRTIKIRIDFFFYLIFFFFWGGGSLQNTITIEESFLYHFHQVFYGDIVNDSDVDAIDEPLINITSESAAFNEDITQLEVQDAVKAWPGGLTGGTGCCQSLEK